MRLARLLPDLLPLSRAGLGLLALLGLGLPKVEGAAAPALVALGGALTLLRHRAPVSVAALAASALFAVPALLGQPIAPLGWIAAALCLAAIHGAGPQNLLPGLAGGALIVSDYRLAAVLLVLSAIACRPRLPVLIAAHAVPLGLLLMPFSHAAPPLAMLVHLTALSWAPSCKPLEHRAG